MVASLALQMLRILMMKTYEMYTFLTQNDTMVARHYRFKSRHSSKDSTARLKCGITIEPPTIKPTLNAS